MKRLIYLIKKEKRSGSVRSQEKKKIIITGSNTILLEDRLSKKYANCMTREK